uniref:FLYWCH-type domain-containing protein n=1 Tax=Steinernema glaseri TaxID=37863 RepID=A0A1I8AMY2_9BILA
MSSTASTSMHPLPEIDWEQMSFSKTLNKSLLTVKQPDGSYRIYRQIRAYRETQHFRCSTCDRLNDKKNTRYMPKVRTKCGKLVGDPYPPHNPECLPLSVEEYGLRQIDRMCRWYIKEKHIPPKAAWEMGRRYCSEYATRHGLPVEDFVRCFPEYDRLRATYTRIYNKAGGQAINAMDDISTMTLDFPPMAEEGNLEFLYAADREQPVPVPNESLEDIDEGVMSAHDLRRKLDQLTSVVELPIDPETGEKVFTVTYEELKPQVVCMEGDDQVTLFFSKKCRPQITFRGNVYYLFTEKSQAESMFKHRRWHCIEPRCTGFIITDEELTKIVDCNVVHIASCASDVNKARMKVEMYHLRLLAEYTTCSLQELYADFCDKLLADSAELASFLPTRDTATRMLERHRMQLMIRTRFEFEQLNRIARSGFEESANAAIRRRVNKTFPKTVCFHCGSAIGELEEGASEQERKKNAHATRFAQEGLVEHLVNDHGEAEVGEKTSIPSLKMSQFKAYLKHLATKKHKFVRKGYYAGGTYYLCQCDGRAYGYKHQNTIPGVHCPAYIKVVEEDDGQLRGDKTASVEFNMNHMFHEDVEGAEEFMSPEEFLKSLPEDPEVAEEDCAKGEAEAKPEEELEEPASKRPRRQATLKRPKYADMNGGIIEEEEKPPTPQSRPAKKVRAPRKTANPVNYAVAEQLDEFEAYVESLRDRVKSLKNADEIARVNAKLQELDDEISGKLDVRTDSDARSQHESFDQGPMHVQPHMITVSHHMNSPPQLMPVITAHPPRHQVTVLRPVTTRESMPSTSAPNRVRVSQVDTMQPRRLYSVPLVRQAAEQPSGEPMPASHVQHEISESQQPFKYAFRKPDGSVIFLTKTPNAKVLPKRMLRLTPIQAVDQNQPIEVVETD